MYSALMFKLRRAEKPDADGPGQQTSWLEGFSPRPALKATQGLVGQIWMWCVGERAPVHLLGDAFVKEAAGYWEAGGEEARDMHTDVTQHILRACHF